MEKVVTATPRPKTAEPWKQISFVNLVLIVLASVVPLGVGLIAMLVGLQFELALLLVFLPVQVLVGALVGRRVSGKRGLSDAILQVLVIFFAASVLVLLISVVWSVIESGMKTLSWQFFTQNNVYISPTTSLEYGGVGHAIIGTLLVNSLASYIVAKAQPWRK